MEEKIRQAVSTLKRNFAYLWFAALFIIILGESGGFNLTGAYADNVRAVYFTETIVILLTACCIPAALNFQHTIPVGLPNTELPAICHPKSEFTLFHLKITPPE